MIFVLLTFDEPPPVKILPIELYFITTEDQKLYESIIRKKTTIMKKLLFLIAASLGVLIATIMLTSCNNQKTEESKETTSGTSAEDKEERNKKTAMASIEAFSNHNIDLVFKDVTADAVDYGDGSMPPMKSRDSIRAGMTAWQNAVPDVKGENIKAVADGEWVMIWADWKGTWTVDFMGQKATGKSFKYSDVDIFRFNEEGKMTEHHNIQPFTTIANQIGLKLQ
jgi:hypothetical protein